MTTIPAESAEIETFTPRSLANLAVPPVFKLRPATEREMRRYRRIMQEEGLEYHPKEELRGEMLRALRALYTPDEYEAAASRMQSLWALIDQNVAPDPAEIAHVDDLIRRLTKEWRPLARLGADNSEFLGESLRIAVSMFVVGWTGLDLAFRREDGRAPLDLIDALERKLGEVERQALADKVAGVAEGAAFLELSVACQARMNISGDEEKNSESPPPSQLTRNGSTTRRSSKTGAARSKASASSGSRKG